MCNKKGINRALLTGATGFVGSHLTRRLVAEGWEVHIITRPSSDEGILHQVINQVKVHVYDGSTDTMLQIMETAQPDVVFHLASLFLAQHQPGDIAPMFESNLLFGCQLAEAMVRNGVHRLINTGTSWQHYENSKYNPVCLYAATKEAYEKILEYYTATSGLKVTTLKLFDTYGPLDPRGKLFSILKKVSEGNTPLAMSPGEQLIDLVYIDDVVDAFIIAAQRLIDGKTQQWEEFAVSSGKPIKLKDLVHIYGQVVQKEMSVIWGGRPYRDREVMVPWDRGKILPGWEPTVNLTEGIKRTAAP